MPGIVFTQVGWTDSAEVEWDHATDGAETYTLTGDIHNAMAVAIDMAVWLNDAARPWAASIDTVTVRTREVDNRVDIYFEFTGSNTAFSQATGDAAWNARFGVIGLGGSDGTPADHSVWSDFSIVNWTRSDRSPSIRTRRQSHRMGFSHLAPSRPGCEGWLTAAAAGVLNTALVEATDPRSAYVYFDYADEWRHVVVDRIGLSHHPDDFTQVRCGIDFIGNVVAVG